MVDGQRAVSNVIRHDSNRLETLADVLAGVLAEPLGHPLRPETLIVQSNGMARWLSLRLADRLGICSNVQFPFPASFLWQTLRQTLGQTAAALPETASFDKPVLVWRVLGLLPSLEHNDIFAPLQAYLQHGDDPFRAYDLARRIADVYDQYLVYRPDWIAAWERGEDPPWLTAEQRWQPALWRRLSEGVDDHRAGLMLRFAEWLNSGPSPAGLPPRIAVFGLSALAPQQLELLSLLARHCELHLFLLNPCKEYWGDIRAERDIARRVDSDPAEDYLEVGHPLLASLGKQGRDFFDLLTEQGADERSYFHAVPGSTLLERLQIDILNLHDRGAASGERRQPVLPIGTDDDSVQVHVCHSPTRELEVLHDRLLALLQQNPDLRPSDVVVMTPDIEAYGPLIEAVFGSVEQARFIPYSIADRGPGAERPLLEAVQQLIELGRGRYPLDRVLGFLDLEAVRRRFGFASADLALIRDWLQQTRIRWGVDAADRGACELPATAEHSWRAGLERLLLGYALPGDERRWWAEVLPYDPIEGGAAQVMGRLQSFAEGLFRLRAEIAEARPLTDWVVLIRDWLERFFAPPDTQAEELQAVRSALERIVGHAQQAGFTAAVPLTVVRSALNLQLAEHAGSGGFFAGGVTFATMVPMRSIPFPVVCLIGMNHGSYPRPHRPVDFDLMSRQYRKGDRSRRQDDRYLFLEALLSARRCFYLSHVGRDIRDNDALPPSVLVSELLEVIERGFTPAPGYASIRSQLVVEHPLQAFSRRYFDGSDPALFSHSGELAELSRRMAGERNAAGPFLSQALPPPTEPPAPLSMERLLRFLEHPVKCLLRERLGLQLALDDQVLQSREPFVLDGLERYTLYRWILNWQLDALDSERAFNLARAMGLLPHGRVGRNLFDREWSAMRRFTARVHRLQRGSLGAPVEIDITRGGWRLQGRLETPTAAGLIGYRPATIKPKDRLRLWLRHLLLNLQRPAGVEPVSRWLGLDGMLYLHPVGDAEARLDQLLGLYQRGLCEPLPLFERSSWAYANARRQGKDADTALKAARNQWEDGWHHTGEAADPWLSLALRGRDDPLDEAFTTLAEQFWTPFFAHAEETTAHAEDTMS